VNSSSDSIVLDVNGSDIHAEGARIRARGPVAQVELPGGVRAWSVVGLDTVRKVLVDDRFAKSPSRWPAFVRGEIDDNFPLIGWVRMENMTTSDGEDHVRLRKLIAKTFTLRRVEAMRPYIVKIVEGLLDDLQAIGPDTTFDLKRLFAKALPVQVICDLFGIPDDRRDECMRGGEVNVDTSISPEEAEANVEQWHQAINDVVALKRREPADDLISAMVAAQTDDGSRLTDTEIAGTVHLMLGAGSETTMNLISNAVLQMLTHPDQRELVRTGQVAWKEVIEETLRAESPISQLPFRFTTEDVELEGVTIPAGDPVLIGFAAAGRDPSRHGESADKFDITREDKEHISFGHGVHHCLGAPLGRLEANIALPMLFERFPGLRLAVGEDELRPQGTFLLNGRAELPVRLS
jgi:cytochrome P450